MSNPLRCFIVSVDYSDILGHTLPYNRHHFSEVNIITSPEDVKNVGPIAEANSASVFVTDAFYRDRAKFRKWLALEEGLDFFGRYGWICLMDADVCWPKEAKLDNLGIGCLYSPLRRMLLSPPVPFVLPPEPDWKNFPLHSNVNEHAGYSQIFHSLSSVLGLPPWHETCYSHAGTADSIFQQKWSSARKIRPDWECLHIGEAGKNWVGRATPLLDGTILPGSAEKWQEILEIWRIRRRTRNFDHEKV